MKKIGITGSLSSGKTTASKILSSKKGPLFSADEIVKKLYKKEKFTNLLVKVFKINKDLNLKDALKKKILKKKSNLKKLEKIIHPLVRLEMKKFLQKHSKKRFIFCEIPLLIESKLMKNFDVIFFIKAKKSIRLKRFESKGGNKIFFNFLNKHQLKDIKKTKYCDHVIVNESNLSIFKKKLLDILKFYE